ncbi:BLOC-1-related complex subunit 8 homolog isoform X1 [Ruditapes philippinarum]|uniref:BLOC-1-related complex subunit 8 homolog isoform X1 n=1 Tax=Ruditapes philippinarum TaxID=129788 RepID=UPI00295AA9F2|nr:BLOC-1-related complex subunit 8 homolog isoform X1 [Ruditapes philippinarum]
MENAFSYVTEPQPRMQGGDSRYNRLAQVQMFKEANPDLELEAKTKKVTEKLSESMNIIANEPSLAFFRIQEHVRKCLPQLAETKHEVQDLQQKVQGASFDAEYAANAVHEMHKSSSHFTNIQDLLKNSMFLKQQIDYEQNRREQIKNNPGMYSTISSPNINLHAEGGGFERPATPVHGRHKHSEKRRGRVRRVMSEHIE